MTNEPGLGERAERFSFETPVAARIDHLTAHAKLWYRKANPDFLDRVYGRDPVVRSPVTKMSQATAVINIEHDAVSQLR